jgi:hypothetical protein
MGHLDWGGIFEEGPRSMVSHHVPVGSLPRAGGWDRGQWCSRAIFFFSIWRVHLSFVVFQELHSMCIGRFSISVWSDHLMIGLHPALMGLSAVVDSHHIPVGSHPGAGVGTVTVVPRPMAF